MAAVVLQLISIFFCCVSGAFLQYGSTPLFDSPSNVTLTVGATERVYCAQPEATGPVPTSIEWYNPQGQLVSRNGGDAVNQVVGLGGGRITYLTFRSYQQSQGGKYECRVAGPGNNTERLPVCIVPILQSPPLLSIMSGSSWLYVIAWNAQSATIRVLYRESGAPDYQVNVPTTSQLSHNISALQPNTLYNIVVEAKYNETLCKNKFTVNSSVTTAYTTPNNPEHVYAQVMSTNSIKVSWTPAPTASSVSVTYYINASLSTYQTVRKTVADSYRQVVISGLHPFTEYYITVQAGNSGGLSEATGRSATTLTAAPSASPKKAVVREKQAHWVVVGWSIPPQAGRNGIIISYIVQLLDTHGAVVRNETVAVQDPTFDSPQSLAHNLTSLKPNTRYVWRVAAITTAGVGPFISAGASAQFRTLQWTPGPVLDLSYEKIDTSINIAWKPPKEPNGDIVAYFVEHGVCNKPGVPYNVTVRASTAVGKGEPVSIVVFTEQQVEAERVYPVSTNSSSATGVGLFLGGVVAGALGVLLIVGIVGGACLLRRSKHKKSSPSGKAAGEDVPMEDVPMEDNPAYGEINIYDAVKEPKEN